ncbi:MAG: hypothetical protein AB7T38_03810 [Nitrospirales bacterium]
MASQWGVGEVEQGTGSLSVRARDRKRGRSGCPQQAVEPGWSPWWGTAGQAQVRENLANHRRIFDRGNEC